MIKIESKHYTFHVRENSLPHKEIDNIVTIQENAYNKITKYLNYSPDLHINYFLLNSPVLCGKQYSLRKYKKANNCFDLSTLCHDSCSF